MRKIALLGFFALVTIAPPASAKPLKEWNNFIVAPEQIIKCYNPSVRRWKAKIVEGSLSGADGDDMDKYAQRSQLVQIIYNGPITGIKYEMLAGVLEENGQIFAIPVVFARPLVSSPIPNMDDNQDFESSGECSLSDGVPVKDIPPGKHAASSTPPP